VERHLTSTDSFTVTDKLGSGFIIVPKKTILNIKNGNAFLVYSILKTFENNVSHIAYPSFTTIQELSGLSRETVNKSIKFLIKNKYINKDKKVTKNGHTHNVYEIISNFSITNTASPTDPGGAGLPIDSHRESGEEVPPTPPNIVGGASIDLGRGSKTKGGVKASPIVKPDDVSDEVWSDWLSMRKQMKANVTNTLVKSLRNKANKVDISLEEAIIFCISRNWRGFESAWYTRIMSEEDELEKKRIEKKLWGRSQ
jgi:hypothetical protein